MAARCSILTVTHSSKGRAAGSAWRSAVAEPLAVNNRVVLHLLNSLQRLRIKTGAGGAAETRRISFRALGVEQIGYVYEGLLDHTTVRAGEPVLGIKGTRSKEPEISLAKLVSLQAQGQEKLIEFLKKPAVPSQLFVARWKKTASSTRTSCSAPAVMMKPCSTTYGPSPA